MAGETHLKPEFLITDEAQLRQGFPAVNPLALDKCQDRLDKHTRAFIARSPFLCISTQSSDGRADVSPRGDPKGFVKALDDKTLLIPDRPGNNRLDTLSNILANPAVGLLFMVPGFDDTLRVNGTAQISRDPNLLAMMKIQDRQPLVAIVVSIREVFLHCAKAFRRSRLWDASLHQDRREMPSLPVILRDQTSRPLSDPDEIEKVEAALEQSYRRSMY